MTVPLSILDLAPLVSGGTAGDALRRTLDLARHAEQFGYHRYWVPEQQRRLRAGHPRGEVVLGHPVAVITELLGPAGQVEGAAQRVTGGAAGHQRGEIEDGQRYGHG